MASQDIFKWVRVRSTEGMGEGLFAANYFIPKGTILFTEEPLVTIPHHSTPERDIHNFCDKYWSLPSDAALRYDELYHDAQRLESFRYLFASVDRWYSKWRRDGGRELNASPTVVILKSIKAYAAFWTNCAASPNDTNGAYPIFSKANHSCRPNCGWSYKAGTMLMQVYTTADVQPGEQLFVCYATQIIEQPLTWRERQNLLKNWGFVCNCKLCSTEL